MEVVLTQQPVTQSAVDARSERVARKDPGEVDDGAGCRRGTEAVDCALVDEIDRLAAM
jgi:hypothetical protein